MFLLILKYVAVLAAAGIIGSSFLKELKKARALDLPWYRPYMTLPGIVVILAILLPIILRLSR